MNYILGDVITINGIKYTIRYVYKLYYKIQLKDKYGLIDKINNKIVVEPIYDSINVLGNYFRVRLNHKSGLISSITCKFLLNLEYDRYNIEELIKIYKDLVLKSKMRVEKLKQLEEMI
jgi:hypothetical protein